MVNAFRAGTIVAVLAARDRLVHGAAPAELRRAHPGHRRLPRRRRRDPAGRRRAVRLLRLLRRRRPGDRRAAAARAGRGDAEESAVTGTVQAFPLACGFLFIALYKGFLGGVNALLFGSFLGITAAQVRSCSPPSPWSPWPYSPSIGRPLLFASVDPDVAAARGVPVRLLSTVFLVLLGADRGRGSQITGALLVFALLVMPAGHRADCSPPARAVQPRCCPSRLALVTVWVGLIVAYYSPYPIGFWVTTFAFGLYALACLWRPGSPWLARRPHRRIRNGGDRVIGMLSPTPSSSTRSWPAPRSRSPPGWSATSWCCAPRSSPATRSPRRLHRRAGRARRSARRPRRPVRRHDRRRSWLGTLGRRGRPDDVVIGSVFAWILGPGRLLPHPLHHLPQRGNGGAGVTVLFGSIFGLSAGRAALDRGHRRRHLRRDPGDRPAAAVRQPRRGRRRRPRRARTPARLRLPRPGRRHRRRGHPGRRFAAAARPARRPGRCRQPPHHPTAARTRTVRRDCGIRVWIGLAASYAIPQMPPSFAILATATLIYLISIAATKRPRRSPATADPSTARLPTRSAIGRSEP